MFMLLLNEAPKPNSKMYKQTFQQNDVDCDRKPKSLAGKKMFRILLFIFISKI